MEPSIYAQVVGYIVNLIGDAEVGLPNPYALCVDITDMENQPQVGDAYSIEDDEFMSQEEYYERYLKVETPDEIESA